MNIPDPITFEYFRDPQERAMIAETGFRIAEYMQQEDIGTLVLVDRAARNLHIPVREAYRQISPDTDIPSVYFLNPAGFLSPELHARADYKRRLLQDYSDMSGAGEIELLYVLRNPSLDKDVTEAAEITMKDESRDGGRLKVASMLTPLFDKAISSDDTFNGRVLVLDACRHTGGAIEGIATALRDIGVVDVRTAVVNNIMALEPDKNPDFVVFNNDEIKDVCKPFGTQKGLIKGLGNKMISSVARGGLSSGAKVARRELHQMMKTGQELRERFETNKGARQSATELPLDILKLLSAAMGADPDGVGIIEIDQGLIIPINLDGSSLLIGGLERLFKEQ